MNWYHPKAITNTRVLYWTKESCGSVHSAWSIVGAFRTSNRQWHTFLHSREEVPRRIGGRAIDAKSPIAFPQSTRNQHLRPPWSSWQSPHSTDTAAVTEKTVPHDVRHASRASEWNRSKPSWHCFALSEISCWLVAKSPFYKWIERPSLTCFSKATFHHRSPILVC